MPPTETGAKETEAIHKRHVKEGRRQGRKEQALQSFKSLGLQMLIHVSKTILSF